MMQPIFNQSLSDLNIPVIMQEFPQRCLEYKTDAMMQSSKYFLDMDCMIHSQVLSFQRIVVYLALISLLIWSCQKLIDKALCKMTNLSSDYAHDLTGLLWMISVLLVVYFTGLLPNVYYIIPIVIVFILMEMLTNAIAEKIK